MEQMRGGWTRTLKLLLASSRPLQATISIAQPLLAAFLAIGAFPRPDTLLLLIVGSIAGMFSVFALNDFLDSPLDERMAKSGKRLGWDMDSVFARHPVGLGLVSPRQQAAWMLGNALVAIAILYALSPLALAFFFLAVLLEIAYCRLAMVTALKALVSGLVVALVGLVGWLAVNGRIDWSLLLPITLLLFAWEIGGRNISNDFSDVEEDRQLGIRTIPSVHGARWSAMLIAAFDGLAIMASIWIGMVAGLGTVYLVLTALVGLWLLAEPAVKLLKDPTPAQALAYFNKASLYPLLLLAVLSLHYILAI